MRLWAELYLNIIPRRRNIHGAALRSEYLPEAPGARPRRPPDLDLLAQNVIALFISCMQFVIQSTLADVKGHVDLNVFIEFSEDCNHPIKRKAFKLGVANA